MPDASQGAAARRLQQQDMKLSRNPPGDPGLDRSEVLGLEFMPACPKVLGGRGIGDPHVDPQQARARCSGRCR